LSFNNIIRVRQALFFGMATFLWRLFYGDFFMMNFYDENDANKGVVESKVLRGN